MFPAASPYQSRLQALTDHVYFAIFRDFPVNFLLFDTNLCKIIVYLYVWSILYSNEVVTGDVINWFNHICSCIK